jgi:hypothetical protein
VHTGDGRRDRTLTRDGSGFCGATGLIHKQARINDPRIGDALVMMTASLDIMARLGPASAPFLPVRKPRRAWSRVHRPKLAARHAAHSELLFDF